MSRRSVNEVGMSLVEVTIILMTLAILTAVAAPAITDYVQDARDTKAKEDIEAIGTAVSRLVRDTGKPGLVLVASTAFTEANRVDLLVSEGNVPDVGTQASYTNANLNDSINWDEGDATGYANDDTMLNQFLANAPAYTVPQTEDFTQPGPSFGIGWRGAYLGRAIGPDPWGNRYMATTAFLGVGTDAADTAADGYKGWTRDAIVISAGRNGVMENPVGGTTNAGTGVSGDDVYFVIAGNSR